MSPTHPKRSVAQAFDGGENAPGVGWLRNIRGDVSPALDGGINIHALSVQFLTNVDPVGFGRPHNRRVTCVEGGGNETSKAIQKHFIVRTEDNLVAVGGIRSFVKL